MNRVFLFFLVVCCFAIKAGAEEPTANPTKDYRDLPRDAAFELGKGDALKDFDEGTYKILLYGMRAMPTEAEKIQEKVGIKFDAIAGCVVSEGILGYADGYNSTMMPLLKKKFGEDVFKE